MLEKEYLLPNDSQVGCRQEYVPHCVQVSLYLYLFNVYSIIFP
jgi:hypothetical protein